MRTRSNKLMTCHQIKKSIENTDQSERIVKLLRATPSQQAAFDRILDGEMPKAVISGPFLLKLGDGAKLLGVSRATLWRMCKQGRLVPIEILPGTHRVSRADLESLASHSNKQVGGAR